MERTGAAESRLVPPRGARPYTRPRLVLFGDLAALTQANWPGKGAFDGSVLVKGSKVFFLKSG